MRNIASQAFGISHVTIQIEDSEDGCVEDHHVGIRNDGPDAGYSTQRLYSGMMYLVAGFLVELCK